MKELIELNQTERQLIVYDVFRTFEEVRYGDIQFVLRKFEKRTLQRDIRDLTDAGLLCVKYIKSEQIYIHIGQPTGEIVPGKNISKKKIQHLKRLQRLTRCMCIDINDNPVEAYFKMFPEASERMRQRDFETLRHIGFDAGYSREYHEYVIMNDTFDAYDGYGIFIKDGKMLRYL